MGKVVWLNLPEAEWQGLHGHHYKKQAFEGLFSKNVYYFVGRQCVWQLTRAILRIKCDAAGNMHVHI